MPNAHVCLTMPMTQHLCCCPALHTTDLSDCTCPDEQFGPLR